MVGEQQIPRRVLSGGLAMILAMTGIVAVELATPGSASAASTISQTFNYSASTQTFSVPAGVTQLTITAVGGEGGLGGSDASGNSFPGGYQGQVTGTMSVTPGQVLTIGVGAGGTNGTNGATGPDSSNVSSAAPGGTNPLTGYNGGNGGIAGWQGDSGDAGGGGAATVVQFNGSTIVAAGSGGAGGSGQFAPTRGRAPYSTFNPAPGTTTAGQVGITIYNACMGTASCDGGGGGPGGGGVQGGAQGAVEFGSGTSDEWFGYGGYPGSNSTASLSGLTASYQPYSNNAANGYVTIGYATGVPDEPTNLTGTAGNLSAGLSWTPPANAGGSAITDYVTRYGIGAAPSSWTTVDPSSANTSATITGLANGTGYSFEVAAVNTTGQGAWTAPSSLVTPIGPPPAPVITTITPADGAVSVAFTQGAGAATVLGYEYSLDGGSTWVSAGVTASPLTVSGLTNGTAYSVEIRADSSVGPSSASSPISATPAAVPGAPTITSISTSPEAASVSFTPGYGGGGTAIGYEYQLDGGSWVSGGATSPISITGLADGTTYSVALRADSTSGTSSASLTSSFTTPSVPGAPTVTVTSGDTQLSIEYAAGNPGGSTITGYDYSLDGGSTWLTAGASPIVVTGLTNGQPYSVSVRADNVIGNGTPSTPQSATPATTPSAPTITSNNAAGSGQLSVNFTAPSSSGGATIINYQYSTDAGATWLAFSPATTASPAVISTLSSDGTTTLTNTTYPIELRAVNSVGAGVASATNDGTAATVPGAPRLTSVAIGSGSLQVSFTPAANGGSPIIGYEYTLDGGSLWQTTGTLGNSFTISGLTNGTSYPVQVQAINALGDSSASNTITGTPSTTPAQPTITGVVRSNHTLTVSVGDGSDGGAAITNWQYSTDGGTSWQSAASATSPLTITTLSVNGSTQIANGTSYPIVVRAVNAAGVSAASTVTNVGPAAPPSAPIVSLTAQNQAVAVTFSIPDNGGSPITAIEYQLGGGSWINAGTLSSPFTISGLTNGTAYTVNVRADNAIGNGTASNPAVATPYTVPGAPTAVTAISDTASADVSWTAPASNGGSTITAYTATAYTDPAAGSAVGAACVTSVGTTSCTITGLANGTSYYVAVVATNAAGSGLPSSPRSVVTPLARPSAPTLGSITAGDTILSVQFTAGNLNGSALVTYQYQLNGGAWVNTSATTSPLVITGLVDGTSYTVAMREVSVAGNGAASATSPAATPYTYPDAPDPATIVTTGLNGSLLVSWAAPNNNGSPITGYTATAFNALTAGSQINTCTTPTLSCTISGLSNGTTYYVSLQATNTAGLSVRSTPRVPGTPAAVPNAPAAPTGTGGNGQVTLTWSAPGNNGSAITDYAIYYSTNGVNYTLFNDGVSTATSAIVTGLTNGSAYTFEVAAANANGTGAMSPASSPITPITTGTTPTLSATTSTNSGYAFTITNYDAATSYSYSFSPTGPAATRAGSTVTVTGLAPGASSTVTVTATKTGFTTTTASIAGSAIPAGTSPTFGTPAKAVDGFSVLVTNFDNTAFYTFVTSSGSLVTNGATVTVTGLAPAASSTLTVTVAKSGVQNASASTTGSALAAGTTPTFANLIQTADGYTFSIANYDASLTYTLTPTSGTASRSAALVTVTGLAAGVSSTVSVTAVNPGVSTATAQTTDTALLSGTTPVFSTPASTSTGYTFTITNYDAATTYSYAFNPTGPSASRSGNTVTVTGLAPGATSTITVTATKTGSTTATAIVSGSALLTGATVTASAATSTAAGYVFTITNYDTNDTYLVAADSSASASIDTSGAVTVTGLTNGASATTTVTATCVGCTTTTLDVVGSALLVGLTPTLSTATSTNGGYTFTIANYDPSYTYTATTTGTGATVTIDSGGVVTVSGVASGASSTTTVTASGVGHTTAAAQLTGSALLVGVPPVLSNPTVSRGGFNVTITNYDPSLTYTATTTAGTVTVSRTGLVTITGLAPNESAVVVVTVSRSGSTDAAASVHGSALIAGSSPTFSPGTALSVPSPTSRPVRTSTSAADMSPTAAAGSTPTNPGPAAIASTPASSGRSGTATRNNVPPSGSGETPSDGAGITIAAPIRDASVVAPNVTHTDGVRWVLWIVTAGALVACGSLFMILRLLILRRRRDDESDLRPIA
jgi:uncharacterized cupredoxin-like copper-binding protein